MSKLDLIKKIKNKLFYPFSHDMSFMILLWGLLSVSEVIIQVVKNNFLEAGLFLVSFLWISYLLVLVCGIYQPISKTLKIILFVLISLYTGLNLFCVYVYHTRLNYNFIEIIMQTNPQEVREYFSMYIGWRQYLYFILFIIFMAALYWLTNYRLKFSIKQYSLLFSVIICGSVLAFMVNPARKESMELWNFKLEDIVDLRNYPTNPVLTRDSLPLPEKFIIIIGESHAKSHSSLYGYEKLTNPLLAKRLAEGNLFVFDNVKSVATNTSRAFKYILNTATPEFPDTIPWYRTTNLIEVLKTLGYHTTWISNQARQGLYNNLSSAPADLCDESHFIRQYWSDIKYDGELVDIATEDKIGNSAIFYHLMGQHVLFKERYPENFGIFSAEDYSKSKYSSEAQQRLAEYDNATLYNDYVIDKLIKKYADTDAIIIYFPDHGLDVYESDLNYIGHATQTPASQKIGVEIPFIVYLSDKFIQLRPELATRLKQSTHRDFVTDKFIYAAMDAMGVGFSNSEDVKKASLFR